MPRLTRNRPKVFISHASCDAWVAKQIEAQVQACGADTFLDCEHIEHGDDFDQRIVEEAEDSTELVVLFTPKARERKYIWIEIGMFLGARKRIVGVLYGVTKEEIATDLLTPVALKRIRSVDINEIDSYLRELQSRIESWGEHDGE